MAARMFDESCAGAILRLRVRLRIQFREGWKKPPERRLRAEVPQGAVE